VGGAWRGGDLETIGRGQKRKGSLGDDDYGLNGFKASKNGNHDREDVIGIIEKIRLENFMCHSNFIWEPNTCVNFVTGSNGSGKSSILQALVLGLMGESKHIKRYSKVSEFVKKDCSRAVIQVTLRNTGEEAYKPELYGPSLTFQRTITENGTSSYLLKDSNMKDVVRKSKEAKDECKRILDKFQIQVDSPIVILQQDEAKELLKIESPQQLYRFFEKATLIKQCFDEYSEAQAEYSRAQENLKEKARALRHLTSDFKKSKQRYEEIQRNNEMNEDLLAAKGEYAWARVHAARLNIKEIQENMGKLNDKMEHHKEKLMSSHEVLAEMKLRKTEMSVSLEDESTKFSTQEQDLLRLKEELDQLKMDLKELNGSLKKETNNKNSLVQEIRVLQDQLEFLAEKEKKGESVKKVEQRKFVLHKLEVDRKTLEERINQEGVTREAQDQWIKQDQEKEALVDKEIRNKKERKTLLQRELDELQGAQEQHLAVFGAKIPLVDRAIKRSLNQFRKPPVGPVGAYVKLTGEAATNPELGRLVETELSRAQLTAYLTNDDHDRRALMRVLDEVYGGDTRNKPRIFTSKFFCAQHQVRRPRCDQPVLLDYIMIDSPVVFNHLVDQKSIESILVCRTQDIAKSLMTHKAHVPEGVSYTITHDFYRFFPARDTTSYRSYYMEVPTGSGMLRATMSNLVQERTEEMKGLAEHLRDLDIEKGEVIKSRKSFEAERRRAMGEIQRLRKEVAKLNSQMSEVKSEDETNQSDSDSLRARLRTRQTELNVAEEKIGEVLANRDMMTNLLKEKESMFKDNKKELNELKSSTNPISQELRTIETKISSKTKEMLNQEKLIKKIKSEIVSLESDIKKNEDEEKQFAAAARKITKKELEPEKTPKQLNAKIVQLKKKLSMKEGNQDVEQFITEFNEIKERYTRLKGHIDTLNSHLETISQMKKERSDNILYIRTLITNSVRRKFNEMIKKFSASIGSEIFLRIDHLNKELKFIFKNETGSHSNTDVSALSGGEKSYTQMCLICSLWDMMQPPFRCLDEWDVFLDAVNRREISQELLKFSLRNRDRQFIFISPQGACDLRDVDHGVVSVTEIKKS